MKVHKNRLPIDSVVKYGLQTMHNILTIVDRTTQTIIREGIEDVGVNLDEVGTDKLDNITREIDEIAERSAHEKLMEAFLNTPHQRSLEVWGEERLGKKQNQAVSFAASEKTIALLDMVDGTDLVNRGLGNWCSAMVFFFPPTREILAAIVGNSNREYFVARGDKEPPFKLVLKTDAQKLKAISLENSVELKIKRVPASLKECAVCFYGQKANHLLSIAGAKFPQYKDTIGTSPFIDYLGRTHVSSPPFRIYTLAGNPMLAKVADGKIHAVFELLGQKAHDVVPGAFIAKCAGAIVKDLDGNDLDLAGALLNPNKPLRYIVAANEAIYNELRSELLS